MKHKKKDKSAGHIAQRPDEVFAAGPIRMARFGRHTVSKIEWRPGDFDKFQERLVAGYDDVVREIDRDVADAAALVATLNPLVILHRAWWERSAAYLKIDSEIAVQHEHVHATRMLDYVQSLVASAPPNTRVPDQPSEEVWSKLQELVESIFQKLNSMYFLCATAKRRKERPDVDPAFEEFHFKTQLYWCNVTGEQYQNHQVQALRELLAPQSEIILQLYDLTTEQLCAELAKIWHSLTRGIGEAFEAMNSFREKSLAALEADVKSGVAGQGEMSQLLQESIVRHGLELDQNRAVGLFILYDLFDLQKVTTLPTAFLEDFSWSPGQDSEFFVEGDFRGWPLRIWPTFKRPFIKLDGRYYCFDQTSLFDHFYRQLEKRVFAAGKNVKQRWIDARKGVTETLPFDYLKRLLPGAVCFKEAYYLMGEGGKSASRYETDGFLTFDDHLFIVEVKSGAFTYTSPATDVDAHVQSLKNLVADPAKQGNRFLRYLQSAEEVAVMDEAGNEMTKLRLQDYRQVTVCAVTLDPFTEIAAQIQHLPAIGVEVGIDPVWSLSVDDLRVYADIFTNPLEFLHFVQQRKEAFKSKILQLDDELDHLGLYLLHNHYAMHAGDLAGGPNAQLQFLGYREEIDKLFNRRLLEGPVPSPLRQKMPVGMANLLDLLQASAKKGRSAIAAYLLDVSGEWRDRLFDTLVQEVAQDDQKQPRPFSTYGEIRLTAVPWTPHWGRPSAEDSRNHVKAIMVMNNEPDRVLLDLSYSENGHLVGADWQFLQRSDITLFELPILQAKAESLRESRLRKAVATKGRIGRNDKCPCGSAKKFKKCCLGKE